MEFKAECYLRQYAMQVLSDANGAIFFHQNAHLRRFYAFNLIITSIFYLQKLMLVIYSLKSACGTTTHIRNSN